MLRTAFIRWRPSPTAPAALAALLASACFDTAEPAQPLDLPLSAGAPSQVHWTASSSRQVLWLDVRTSGGRSLSGPIEVYAGDVQVVDDRLALTNKRLDSAWFSRVTNWWSTPSGVRGQIYLIDLPSTEVGTPMRASVNLQPGNGVVVDHLVLQVR